jgi:hypothetical protein
MTLEEPFAFEIAFADPPDGEVVANFWLEWIENPNNEDPIDMRADKNGTFGADGFPTPGIGELPFDFDFSYPESSEAFTAASGGYPLGDLNWFPEKKAEWEESGKVVDTEETAELPSSFQLLGNYPNPFNPSTRIHFDLPWTADVEITVYDPLGREVLTVPAGEMAPGTASVFVDASGLTSGMYLYRVTAESLQEFAARTGTMLLVK